MALPARTLRARSVARAAQCAACAEAMCSSILAAVVVLSARGGLLIGIMRRRSTSEDDDASCVTEGQLSDDSCVLGNLRLSRWLQCNCLLIRIIESWSLAVCCRLLLCVVCGIVCVLLETRRAMCVAVVCSSDDRC